MKQSRSFHEEGPLIATYAPISSSLPLDTGIFQLDGGAFATTNNESEPTDTIGLFMIMCSHPPPLQLCTKSKQLVLLLSLSLSLSLSFFTHTLSQIRAEQLEEYHQFVNQTQQEIHTLLNENDAKTKTFDDLKREGSLFFGDGFLLGTEETDAPFPFDEGDML